MPKLLAIQGRFDLSADRFSRLNFRWDPSTSFVRCIMGLALRAGRGSLRVDTPRHWRGTGGPEVRIGMLARKTPPPPTFSFDADPEDEGFAGARVAIKDNNTTGAFTDSDTSGRGPARERASRRPPTARKARSRAAPASSP